MGINHSDMFPTIHLKYDVQKRVPCGRKQSGFWDLGSNHNAGGIFDEIIP
jgi:hypothetical protein